MKKTITLIAWLLLLSCFQLAAQDRQISGKITSSEDKLGIPGISVVVAGTTIGTSTDIDGNYKLTVPATATQVKITGVGMKSKTIELTASNNIDVVMDPDVLKLDEVVVTALGIKQEKKRLAYAVQDINGDEISRSGETNVIEGLSGKVAGVQVTQSTGDPGASAFISIRGLRAFDPAGDNQPLFVVDGVPIDNSTFKSGNPDVGVNNLVTAGVQESNRGIDLNPEDIESVSVLKGPAAAALYGLRAGNGVILITTKKGHATQGRKVNVVFSTSLTFDQINKFPDLQTKYAQGVKGGYKPPQSLNRNSWGPDVSTLSWDGVSDYPYDSHGNIVNRNDPSAKIPFTPYDNRKDFFETGTTHVNNISISGGNDVSSFYTSASYTDQQGIVPLSTFKKTTIRVGGETALSSEWKITGSAEYIKSGGNRVQNGSNTSGIMLGLLRTPVSFDNTGGFSDPANTPAAYVLNDGTPRAYRPTIYDNPYWSVNRNPFKDDVNRLLTNFTLSYSPKNWLNILYRPGIDMYSDRRHGGYDIYSGNNPAGQIYEDQHFFRSFSGDLIVNANKKLSDNFDGALILGNNMNSYYHEQLYTQGDAMNIPTFFQMSNAVSVLTKDIITNYRTAAFYADAKLDYKKMLYLDVSGRNEWSTTLPDPTSNAYFYPAVSLGFIFTEAFHMSDNKTLPYGKIRLNWANVGNGAQAYLTQPTTFSALPVSDGWVDGINSPFNHNLLFTLNKTAGNPTLKPTNSTSIEAGIELKFFQNRLALDFSYYNTDTKDGIFPVPVAASSGLQYAIFNAGKINNKGEEILLTGNPVKTKDFNWDITINWSQNKSKVIELIPGVESINLGGFETPSSRLVVGEPYGVIYGGKWLRDSNGNVVIDDSGTPSSNSNFGFPIADPNEGKIGDPNPKWLAGIRSTFTWKRFTLTGLLDIRQGGDIWNGTEGILRSLGTSKETETRGDAYVFSGVKGHVNPDGTITVDGNNDISVVRDENWYRLGNGSGFGPIGEQFIQDGGWVRLREIGLSYSLKKEWLKKTPFASVDISLTGRNLWLKTDYTGVDPESNLTGAGAFRAHGFEYFNNPNTKSYGFSIRVTL